MFNSCWGITKTLLFQNLGGKIYEFRKQWKEKSTRISIRSNRKTIWKRLCNEAWRFYSNECRIYTNRSFKPWRCFRNWWNSKGKNNRNIWTWIFRKNNSCITYDCRMPKERRRSSIYRCWACIRSSLCKTLRCWYR